MGPSPGLRRCSPRGPGDPPKQRRLGRGEADEVVAAVQRRPERDVTPAERREGLMDEVTSHAGTVRPDDHDPFRTIRKVAGGGGGAPRPAATPHPRGGGPAGAAALRPPAAGGRATRGARKPRT